MKNKIATRFTAACSALTGVGAAWGHENHGMSGTHWHATDAWGFVVTGLLVALAIWLGGRGK
jgi:hypothetical protein